MDEFVCNLLHECGLSNWIEKFQEDEIDKESLFGLSEEEIKELFPKKGPRAKFRNKLNLLKKEQNATNQETTDSSTEDEQEHEEVAGSTMVGPPTFDTRDKRKRTSDHQGEPSPWQSPKRRRVTIPGSYKGIHSSSSECTSESRILFNVTGIMECVQKRLPNQDNEKLSAFLRSEISDLKIDKRELVGVFGKTGAGKSSLINAVIGEKNLLPSGNINACTTVMIKVEANRVNAEKYEADIEFITKEEWKDELWSFLKFCGDDTDREEDQSLDDDYQDGAEKMSALYGEEWRNISPENLLDNKHFRDIQEFIHSTKKTLTCESAKELSAKLVKYTRSDSKDEDGKEIKRWYWPLVKCVTVRVPHNVLLQHVTLVDLPGTNDRNKSRDEMWKGHVGSCSAVWIVTDTTRPAAERDTWEILESAASHIGNGGQCQQIHFICTKSDVIGDLDDDSAAGVRAQILKTNKQVKETVSKEIRKLTKVKKHFSDDSFTVFTVSSKEFLKRKHLSPEETEIPKLQEFLQELNDCHSETLNYVSGAEGILSLIQGARCTGVAEQKKNVCRELEENMRRELERVIKSIEEAYKTFEKCLSEGVENSKSSCEKDLHSVLYPRMSGCAFHKILKNLVKCRGTYKPKRGKLIELNVKLASCLTDRIDEDFKKTFPNEGKSGPFSGVIKSFSLDTEGLTEKYKDVKLQLTFLKTEEEKVKIKLNKIIREDKKTIYGSLTGTIEKNMQKSYEKAAEFSGKDTLINMRTTLEKHVFASKNTMFEKAKQVMLEQLNDLKGKILKTLGETIQKSIELSLRTDCDSIPDFTKELEGVKKYKSELAGSQDKETPAAFSP